MPSLETAVLAILLGAIGLGWGIASDRISVRWPAHEEGVALRQGWDWRAPVVAVFGLIALASVPLRFDDPLERLLFVAYFLACTLIMATDLDQRIMPDVLTLPAIAVGVVVVLLGGDSLENRLPIILTVAAAILVPMLLFIASLPFGAEAFGFGDVKFLVGVGLLTGFTRIILTIFAAALAGGIVIAVLLVARKITLKSYVPFGPFLVIGLLWVTLLPSATS